MTAKNSVVSFKDAYTRARDSLQNLVSGLGTVADKTVSTTYRFTPITEAQLEAAYRGDWIARKVVDIPAQDSTREWRDWQATKEQITAIEATEDRLLLRQRVRDAMIRARLYGGGVLIVGMDGDDPATELKFENVKKDSLKYVHVAGRQEITAGPINLNPLDELFGEPEYYDLAAQEKGVLKIHPSRVIRFIGNALPRVTLGEAWGDSVLQAVDDAIKQAGVASASLAAMIQESKTDVIKIPNLMMNLQTKEYESRLIDRFQLAAAAKSVVNTLILDKEEEWQRIQTSFVSLPDAIQMYMLIASGAADIPATRMLGQSPAGLNSTGESDIRNYYDMIASQQENILRPALSRLDEILIRSALGSRPEEIFYEWTPLWQMDEDQKAKVVLAKAQATEIYHNTGLIAPEALSEGLLNQLIEDGVYPGLEQMDNSAPPALAETPDLQAQFEELKKQIGVKPAVPAEPTAAAAATDVSVEDDEAMAACMHELKQRHPEMGQEQRIAVCLSKLGRSNKDTCPDPIQDPETGRFEGSRPCAGGGGGGGGEDLHRPATVAEVHAAYYKKRHGEALTPREQAIVNGETRPQESVYAELERMGYVYDPKTDRFRLPKKKASDFGRSNKDASRDGQDPKTARKQKSKDTKK